MRRFTHIRRMLSNGQTSIRTFSKVFEMEYSYFTKTLMNVKEIKMKKYTLYSLMLLTLLFLSACSNSAQPKEENDVQSIKDVTVKIPETIFTSSKRMKRLTKMK